jgi:hypothetical protein
MNRSTLGATLFLCAFFSGISSGAQETRSLKTADTEVRFENTAGGPHLLDLKTNGWPTLVKPRRGNIACHGRARRKTVFGAMELESWQIR